MEFGRERRLKRIFSDKSGKAIIVPMDHGITLGPITGIADIKEVLKKLENYNVNGIILNKGMIKSCSDVLENSRIPLIMHLSASTSLSAEKNYKIPVASVWEAVYWGCDAVSVQINIGDGHEAEMISAAAKVSEECCKYGMPLLAMMYSCGSQSIDVIKHLARIGAEIGADIIKVFAPECHDDFHEIVDSCPVPIVVAGGVKCENQEDFLVMVQDTINSGAKGIAVGRNIFQSDHMNELIMQVESIVHK